MDIGDNLWDTLENFRGFEATMQKFVSLKHFSAKVNLVEELLVKYYSKALNTTRKLQIKKNNIKSVEFKTKGNALFFEKNYYEAFELYNKSISFAEMDSENLSIGYANRSAVLFHWKLYKECLENIKLAKNAANFPEKLTKKLDAREENCTKLLSTQEKPNTESFDFTFNQHPVVPQIADCIKIKYTNNKRGFLFTDRALKVGECILIEEPFFVVSLPNANYQRCANCNTESLILIPCPNCTSTMFCSENCMTEAEWFHKFECPIIDFLNSEFNDQHLLALRITLKGFRLFRSFDKLKKFYDKPQNKNQNLFTLDNTHFNDKKYFRSICDLHTNEKKMHVKEQFLHAADAAILRYYLLRKTPLKDILSGGNSSKIFTEIFFKHLMVSIDNRVLLASHDDDGELFASSITSFMTYIRHSCAPNTFSCHKGTKMYTFVLRPIPANSEILCKYKEVHYGNRTKSERQIELKNDFYFSCKCDACNGNYPRFAELSSSEYVPSVPELSEADLDIISFEDAEKKFPHYCKFLEEYDNHYPCLQLCTIETRLLGCFNILLRAGSLKAKFKKKKLN